MLDRFQRKSFKSLIEVERNEIHRLLLAGAPFENMEL